MIKTIGFICLGAGLVEFGAWIVFRSWMQFGAAIGGVGLFWACLKWHYEWRS